MIVFLLIIALTGISVNFLRKKFSRVKVVANFYQDIGKVNLNTADKNTLLSLPGIGKKMAQRIIAYRQQQMGFQDIEELKQIKGMNEYKYNKIKIYLNVK